MKNKDNIIHYRNGDNDTIRAWRSDWFGDQFAVIEREKWERFVEVAKSLQVEFRFYAIDED